MRPTAKAATIVELEKIEVREYEVPPCPVGGLIMKTEMSGICGTDKHTYRGETTQYGGTVNQQTSPFPLIPGHENVGIVVEVSPGKPIFTVSPFGKVTASRFAPGPVAPGPFFPRNRLHVEHLR